MNRISSCKASIPCPKFVRHRFGKECKFGVHTRRLDWVNHIWLTNCDTFVYTPYVCQKERSMHRWLARHGHSIAHVFLQWSESNKDVLPKCTGICHMEGMRMRRKRLKPPNPFLRVEDNGFMPRMLSSWPAWRRWCFPYTVYLIPRNFCV